MRTRDGGLIEARDDPEKSFDGHQLETPWDDLHLAYFTGEALWTYLNMPFLYTWPGFVSEEIAPIEVEGEAWRRLKVTFPDSVNSHTRQQISCFGPDGLLRRHDFTIDIIGGATGMLYATDYRDVAGNYPYHSTGLRLAGRLPTPPRAASGGHRHGRDHRQLTSRVDQHLCEARALRVWPPHRNFEP